MFWFQTKSSKVLMAWKPAVLTTRLIRLIFRSRSSNSKSSFTYRSGLWNSTFPYSLAIPPSFSVRMYCSIRSGMAGTSRQTIVGGKIR